ISLAPRTRNLHHSLPLPPFSSILFLPPSSPRHHHAEYNHGAKRATPEIPKLGNRNRHGAVGGRTVAVEEQGYEVSASEVQPKANALVVSNHDRAAGTAERLIIPSVGRQGPRTDRAQAGSVAIRFPESDGQTRRVRNG